MNAVIYVLVALVVILSFFVVMLLRTRKPQESKPEEIRVRRPGLDEHMEALKGHLRNLREGLEQKPEEAKQLFDLASHIPALRDFLHENKTKELQQEIERAALEKELRSIQQGPEEKAHLSKTIRELENNISSLEELRAFEENLPNTHPEICADPKSLARLKRMIEIKENLILLRKS